MAVEGRRHANLHSRVLHRNALDEHRQIALEMQPERKEVRDDQDVRQAPLHQPRNGFIESGVHGLQEAHLNGKAARFRGGPRHLCYRVIRGRDA